ncbi:hypothetical protein [Phenylobacterium sp.]|uniref:hypothetical protein n=1 Tax=Phenylobacterium sp. TaxID=1871053 RepID=UPI0035B30E91
MRLWAVIATALATGASAAPAVAGESAALARLLEKTVPVTDAEPASGWVRDDAAANLIERITRVSPAAGRLDVDWNTRFIPLGRADGGGANFLQLSVGRSLRTPAALPLSLDRAVYETDAYEVALRRDWSFARFDAGAYDVDITPHAGLGWSNQDGATAEAGATLSLTQRADHGVRDALNGLGVRDGADFGERGRWYMFAAASGRAVGLNMMREPGRWNDAGWSTDSASALVGDAHVGVGWRKGPLQTSLGYIHREVKGQNMIWGQRTKDDSLVAFSLTIKPDEE